MCSVRTITTPSVAIFVALLIYHVVVTGGLATPSSSSSSSNSNSGSIGRTNLQQQLPPLTSSSSSSSSSLPTIYGNDNSKAAQDTIIHGAMSYFDRSTDPYHAVSTSIELLQQSGFIEYDPAAVTTSTTATNVLRPGGKYYYTRQRSTLVAFAIGTGIQQQQQHQQQQQQQQQPWGIKIIGGHTDSPNLRIKPRSIRTTDVSSTGCIQIGVECYGGGLWHTWFDRDLGISGRVLVKKQQEREQEQENVSAPSTTNVVKTTEDTTAITDPQDSNDIVQVDDVNEATDVKQNDDNDTSSYTIQQQYIQIHRPILRISNLAIHLQNDDERKAFKVNKEDHLSPILAMAVTNALTYGDETTTFDRSKMISTANNNKDGWNEYQEPILLHLLSQELQCNISDIVDFELHLFDVQKATYGGAFQDFIYSSRLDNLASCYMAVQALIHHVEKSNTFISSSDTDVSMIVLYDHEEVGSNSAVGAASPILQEAIKYISFHLLSPSDQKDPIRVHHAYNQCIQNSFVISSDQAHAVHPNYSNKHEKNHQPKMNHGMVIKRNSNQRYATTPITGLIIREISKRAKLVPPIQEFIVRQDCGCGSTIGPIISSTTGIRTIDMGCPQLSMHSIRETMGVYDLIHGIRLFSAYFQHFREVDSSIGK